MARMRPPIVPEQPVPVVPEDGLRRLLAVCVGKDFEARRDTAIVMFLLDTGARRAELADLQLDLEVLGMLLQEAAHGLATARSIQDTSRGGRYHNRRYAQLARELGLDVATVKPIGWSATTVPDHTAGAYAGQLAELAAVLVVWRRQEHRIGAGTRSRNLLACACPCGRKLRASRTTLQEAPIVCGLGAQPFEPEEPED